MIQSLAIACKFSFNKRRNEIFKIIITAKFLNAISFLNLVKEWLISHA